MKEWNMDYWNNTLKEALGWAQRPVQLEFDFMNDEDFPALTVSAGGKE